jgi:serine/threonine protein kinase
VVYKARDTPGSPCRSQSVATRKGYRSRAQTEIRAGGQGRLGAESPNIITIYDIDQTDGVDFIVMEYVQGKTLDAVVPCKGLRLNEALKVATEMG